MRVACYRFRHLNQRAAAFLKSADGKLPLELAEKNKISAHLNSFAKSAKMRDAALALYVNAQVGHQWHSDACPLLCICLTRWYVRSWV